MVVVGSNANGSCKGSKIWVVAAAGNFFGRVHECDRFGGVRRLDCAKLTSGLGSRRTGDEFMRNTNNQLLGTYRANQCSVIISCGL